MRKTLKWILGIVVAIPVALFLTMLFVAYIAPLLRDRTTQCGDKSRITVKEEILSFASKPGRFKHIDKGYDAIEPSGDVAYSNVARVWDQEVFIKKDGKRIGRTVVMLTCDGWIELSTDPDFKPE